MAVVSSLVCLCPAVFAVPNRKLGGMYSYEFKRTKRCLCLVSHCIKGYTIKEADGNTARGPKEAGEPYKKYIAETNLEILFNTSYVYVFIQSSHCKCTMSMGFKFFSRNGR